jgi:hypothetical protein
MSDYVITNENGVDELERRLDRVLARLRDLDYHVD